MCIFSSDEIKGGDRLASQLCQIAAGVSTQNCQSATQPRDGSPDSGTAESGEIPAPATVKTGSAGAGTEPEYAAPCRNPALKRRHSGAFWLLVQEFRHPQQCAGTTDTHTLRECRYNSVTPGNLRGYCPTPAQFIASFKLLVWI